jgi:hypothetical protein
VKLKQEVVATDNQKFNPLKHVATIYDPVKGHRVPVTDVQQIPVVAKQQIAQKPTLNAMSTASQ